LPTKIHFGVGTENLASVLWEIGCAWYTIYSGVNFQLENWKLASKLEL
jgi:hypothetical protein